MHALTVGTPVRVVDVGAQGVIREIIREPLSRDVAYVVELDSGRWAAASSENVVQVH